MEKLPPEAPKVFFTKKASGTHFERRYEPGTYLIFGKETAGLPEWLTERHPADCARIPMYDDRVRSLNLANAVSIAVYEAIRQLGP